MSIRPEEAASALQDIERAERQSARIYGYRKASPHLLLWGVIWIMGYASTYIWPEGGMAWAVLVPAGILASFWISRRAAAKPSAGGFAWRYGATAFAIFLFITATFAVLPPRSAKEVGAFVALLVAILYVLLGVWRSGARMVLLGLAVGALTVGGYFGLPHYFLLWMAGVGGGGLILGGFWLRRA